MKQTVFDLEHADGTRKTVHEGDTPTVSPETARLLFGSDQAEEVRDRASRRPKRDSSDKRAANRETR